MDTIFFILASLVGFFLKVETWLATGMIISLIACFVHKRRLSLVSGIATLTMFLAVALLPLGELLIRPLAAAYPPTQAPEQVDGIIVLGGAEDLRVTAFWGQPQLNGAAERMTGAAALALRFPEAQLVFSGGSGRFRDAIGGTADLPSVATDLFTALGIAQERIVWEKQSRNTTENARYSYDLVKPAAGETWVLVTSAFHMGRALRSFEVAGWRDIAPYPVDYRSGGFLTAVVWGLPGKLGLLNMSIKEWLGRLVYRMTGR